MSVEDPSIWKQLSAYLWGVLIPIGVWAWKKQDSEIQLHRTYFVKIFDKMESNNREEAEKFERVFSKMSDNHSEILKVLGTKADR